VVGSDGPEVFGTPTTTSAGAAETGTGGEGEQGGSGGGEGSGESGNSQPSGSGPDTFTGGAVRIRAGMMSAMVAGLAFLF
jgi:hypothetical protein